MKKIIIIVTDSTIVGSKYCPKDNSYAKNLTNDSDHARVYGHTFILTSEPYKKQVHEGFFLKNLGEYWRLMVKAIDPCTGFEYEMMYEPEWLMS